VAAPLGEREVSLHGLTTHHRDTRQREIRGTLANIGTSHEALT